ncbi:hypothetical protein GCM10029964_060030 [Kibdelosporangium lantanae]
MRDKFQAAGFADARLVPTDDGSHAVVGSRAAGHPHAPTVLLYAHYDVQPRETSRRGGHRRSD